jgi:AraC family transcriptional regulator of adaptative response/methylated-DNA-[protein]-cysteine methyltransferase
MTAIAFQNNEPASFTLESSHLYGRIAEAIEFIAENQAEQPDLDTVAAHIGMSPHHFQRTFSDWAGVSPKKFLKAITLQDAKERLRESESVLDASFGAGLSGPGRLHDLFVTTDAVTPGEYKSRGAGMTFTYGIHPSPFGPCLIVLNARGLTGLSFVDSTEQDAIDYQKEHWEKATWVRDETITEPFIQQVFQANTRGQTKNLKVLLRGSPFRIKIWEALLRLPSGTVTSYGDLAERLDRPGAARAVAGAIANNRIGLVIPCHRVIRESGALAGYRWGETRKAAILGLEASWPSSSSLESRA